jgi:hypothetical protein
MDPSEHALKPLLISPRLLRTTICLIAFSLSALTTAETKLIAQCPEVEWLGQRVGFDNQGRLENDTNGIRLKETLFLFESFPPERGNRVFIRYDGGGVNENTYVGNVTYVYGLSYVIIETQPHDLQEVYSIDLTSGNTILTNTKMAGGFFKDVFTTQCEVGLIDDAE